ncbi:TetR/AcrR family transcriptional regulator [Actinomadura opuntiae]|uniref:TetR/AcrR family transcriptional regulator n=1 Tax=Actinomadura sp. OS1-43 TaxID=604315 RepID=UPI003341740C
MARRASVSATAPYRHYADRDALVSAVAAQGYRELAEHLTAAHPSPEAPDDLAAVAVAYVRFALDHPALFRVMFTERCDPNNEERVSATIGIWEYVRSIVHNTFPHVDPDALATSIWALVHGLAFLHLEGKLDVSSPDVVAAQVRAAVHALFAASPAMSQTAASPKPGS